MTSPRLVLLLSGLMCLFQPAYGQDAERGAQDYKLCAGCHGFEGQGNELVGAPSLAGRESWYLERQIRNFRDGLRGHDADDPSGQTMAAMTAGLHSDEAIRDIVAYVGTLPVRDAAASVAGNAERGRALYAPCAACHGAAAEGNVSLNAPALKAVEDWYQLAQLGKFRSGARGTASGDIFGQQMVPMANTLADDAAMQDVVAYIVSLE